MPDSDAFRRNPKYACFFVSVTLAGAWIPNKGNMKCVLEEQEF